MFGDNLFTVWLTAFWGFPFTAQIFVTAILGLTLIFLFRPGRYRELRGSVVPNFLISLGILGTFFGICAGLINFDPNEIRASVPSLLDGMRTAFVSSVAGIGGGLLVKATHIFQERQQSKNEEKIPQTITVENLYKKLHDIHRSLVGQEESTLLTQVKNFRTDTRDELQRLNKSFEDFKKDMAENNSKALIQALEEVMKDFNAKINEQFGDNFKQLNEAVGKILDWQEVYRQQMDEMIQQQTQTTQNMKESVANFTEIIRNADTLSQVSADLKVLLEGLEAQRNNLERNLKAFADVSDKAVNGLPKIEKEVIRLTEGLSQSIDRSNREINEHIKQVIDGCDDQIKELDRALSEELNNALKSLGENMAAISEKFANDYMPLAEQLQRVVNIARDVRP